MFGWFSGTYAAFTPAPTNVGRGGEIEGQIQYRTRKDR